MRLKAAIKRILVGPPGRRPLTVRSGLLRGLRFGIDPSVKSQRFFGLDEIEIAPFVRRLSDHVCSAIDIGANDGWYSVYFASRSNIEQVVACEPCADLLVQLRQNLELNKPSFAKKVTPVQKFVGQVNSDRQCMVDALIAKLPRPILLKIDVDGGEVEVLRGAQALLSSKEALLVIETHSKPLEDACTRLLMDAGYITKIVHNGWYRHLIPEQRTSAHNRWIVAQPAALS